MVAGQPAACLLVAFYGKSAAEWGARTTSAVILIRRGRGEPVPTESENEHMTNERAVSERVDDEACVAFLAEMVRHRSYSGTEGERCLAEFMVESMRGLGLEAALQPVAGERANAIGRLRGRGEGPSRGCVSRKARSRRVATLLEKTERNTISFMVFRFVGSSVIWQKLSKP